MAQQLDKCCYSQISKWKIWSLRTPRGEEFRRPEMAKNTCICQLLIFCTKKLRKTTVIGCLPSSLMGAENVRQNRPRRMKITVFILNSHGSIFLSVNLLVKSTNQTVNNDTQVAPCLCTVQFTII